MKSFAERETVWHFDGLLSKENAFCITAQGSKHAFLYIFLAALFEPEGNFPIKIRNVPHISDTYYISQYAQSAGAEIQFDATKNTMEVFRGVRKNVIVTQYVINCRSALLAFALHAMRFGTARMYDGLGGCPIGRRKIDQHIKLWTSIGFSFRKKADYLELERRDFASPSNQHPFAFDCDTTMGSVAAIYALRHGYLSHSENISTRMEISSLIEFYNKCNVRIERSNRRISLSASNLLRNACIEYQIPDDPDDAIGWACLAHALGRKGCIKGTFRDEILFQWLADMSWGGIVKDANGIKVTPEKRNLRHDNVCVRASYHPAIGSDQLPILAVWASLFCGCVMISDKKFQDRYAYTDEIVKLGWKRQQLKSQVSLIFQGVSEQGKEKIFLIARDIRGGFAILMAALISGRNSIIEGFEQLQRGYSDLYGRLDLLGVQYKISQFSGRGSVAVILRCLDGRYYMQKRSPDAPKNPNKITFFGGEIEIGESPEEAARRELMEELELQVDISLIDQIRISRKFFSNSGNVYLFKADNPVEIHSCLEGQLWKASADELLEQDVSLFVRCIIENGMIH